MLNGRPCIIRIAVLCYTGSFRISRLVPLDWWDLGKSFVMYVHFPKLLIKTDVLFVWFYSVGNYYFVQYIFYWHGIWEYVPCSARCRLWWWVMGRTVHQLLVAVCPYEGRKIWHIYIYNCVWMITCSIIRCENTQIVVIYLIIVN